MDETLPTSSRDVAALVLALYESSQPQEVVRVQEILSRVQKSSSGWVIALDLLSHGNDHVKFYGALTIIVKLNTESSSLSENDAIGLHQKLIQWLITSLADGSGALVLRKLTSALVTLFLHFPAQCQLPVRHICACLSSADPRVSWSPPEALGIENVLPNFVEPRGLQAALWFAGSVVEEAGKTDMNAPRQSGLYKATVANAPDVACLLSHCFSVGSSCVSGDDSLHRECLRCLQSWIWFSQRISARGDDITSMFRRLVYPMLDCLRSQGLFDAASELISEILSNYPGFFTDAHFDSLFSLLESPWARERYEGLLGGDFDFESLQFGQLLLSLGDCQVQALVERVDHRSQEFLVSLRGLLATQGYPAADDKIFIAALEFWSTFVEAAVDTINSHELEPPPWLLLASSHVLDAASKVWRKVIHPTSDIFSDWDQSDRVAFVEARKDAADFLQSSYALIGPRLLNIFADLTLQQLTQGAWLEMEAASFCLGSLADCVSGGGCDTTLKRVFSSPIFEVLQSRNDIPARAMQTCVSLIEKYAEYFERDADYLRPALSFLFAALRNPTLAPVSSKSIQRLCSKSRNILVVDIELLLDHHKTLSEQQFLDCPACEKVVAGIACVIQAVPSDQDRLRHLGKLLNSLEGDVVLALNHSSMSTLPHTHQCSMYADGSGLEEHMALKVLRCLGGIGKGLQSPSDSAIELDSEARSCYTYHEEQLRQIQLEVLGVINQLQNAFAHSGEITESICSILRTGFSESDPGPFVFPPDVVVQYFTGKTFATPRPGLLVSTSCSFLSSLGRAHTAQAEMIRTALFAWVITLLQQLSQHDNDTELAQNGIEFVTRLLTLGPGVLLPKGGLPLADYFYAFTLGVLDGREPLPKAAAADFWASLVSFRSSDPLIKAAADGVVSRLGPSLAKALIHNIGGHAARSELDRLSEPLKKLVSQHPRARSWLEDALSGSNFLGHDRVTVEDRALFLNRIISLRGSRATNQVVREFWLAARGSKFAYAS